MEIHNKVVVILSVDDIEDACKQFVLSKLHDEERAELPNFKGIGFSYGASSDNLDETLLDGCQITWQQG